MNKIRKQMFHVEFTEIFLHVLLNWRLLHQNIQNHKNTTTNKHSHTHTTTTCLAHHPSHITHRDPNPDLQKQSSDLSSDNRKIYKLSSGNTPCFDKGHSSGYSIRQKICIFFASYIKKSLWFLLVTVNFYTPDFETRILIMMMKIFVVLRSCCGML